MSASTKATKAASSADEFASSAARPRRRGGPLTSEEIEDAERLRLAVETAKNATGLSQEALAALCGWSTQGAVSQYLCKAIPLNLEAAYRFAMALNVPLDAISPRFATKAAELFAATAASNGGLGSATIVRAPMVDPELSPTDNVFMLEVRRALLEREIPGHVKQTILFLLEAAPPLKVTT